MSKKQYTPEQIIRKLCELLVLISQGMKTPHAARQAGIIEQTYYRLEIPEVSDSDSGEVSEWCPNVSGFSIIFMT